MEAFRECAWHSVYSECRHIHIYIKEGVEGMG